MTRIPREKMPQRITFLWAEAVSGVGGFDGGERRSTVVVGVGL